MISGDKKLFFKSSIFTYLNKFAFLAIGFAYTYLIANAFDPGVYGAAMYLLAFIGNLVFLGGAEAFSKTLVVFTPKYQSKNMFYKFIKYSFAFISVAFLAFYLFSGPISGLIENGNPELIKTSAVLFLAFPFFLLAEAFFKGLKSFGKVLKVSVMESVLNLSFAFLLVFQFGYGIEGIFYAKIISLASASVLYFYFIRKLRLAEKKPERKEVKKYLKNAFGVSFLKKASMQSLLVFMGLFISNATLGLYYIAQKIISYMIEIPIVSMSETMLPFVSGKSNDTNYAGRLASLNIKFSIILGVLLGCIALLFGETILSILFPKYAGAYLFFPFMIVIFFGTIVEFLHGLFRSKNRVDVLVKLWVIIFISSISLGLTMIYFMGIYGLLFFQIIQQVFSGIFLYFQLPKLGVKVEIIPRKKDVLYFLSVAKTIISSRGENPK